MPLTDRQEHLLFELYGIPYSSTTIVMGGSGLSSLPPLTELVATPKEHLRRAILDINLDPTKVERVAEILKEYESLSLDASPIDREGYQLRPNRNIRNLQQRLYPYTGIRICANDAHRIPLG